MYKEEHCTGKQMEKTFIRKSFSCSSATFSFCGIWNVYQMSATQPVVSESPTLKRTEKEGPILGKLVQLFCVRFMKLVERACVLLPIFLKLRVFEGAVDRRNLSGSLRGNQLKGERKEKSSSNSNVQVYVTGML